MSCKIILFIASILVMFFLGKEGKEYSKKEFEQTIDPRKELLEIIQEKNCHRLLNHIYDSINFRDDVRNKKEFIEYWGLEKDCKESELWDSWESLILASYMNDSCYSENFFPSCMDRESDLLRVIRKTILYKDSLLTDSIAVLPTYQAFKVNKIIYPKNKCIENDQVEKWVFQITAENGLTGFIKPKNIYNFNGDGFIEFKPTTNHWMIISGS